jgi:hypothetical protein
MDKGEIWGGDSSILESFDVGHQPSKDILNDSLNLPSSLITLFLYMVAELSALQQIINALTGLNGLPAVIVECAVTTIYTCKSHSQTLGRAR